MKPLTSAQRRRSETGMEHFHHRESIPINTSAFTVCGRGPLDPFGCAAHNLMDVNMSIISKSDTDVVIGARAYELSETLQSDELVPIFADAWTASRVWDASAFLSEHLVEFAVTQRHPFHMNPASDRVPSSSSSAAGVASVIELGSGCGLAGLVAASLGGDVLLTDQREAVELLQRNVAANAVSDDELSRLKVQEFTWGSEPSKVLPRSTYDYILISDCINPIYGTESWRNLARSIFALSDAHTLTYLAHEKRGDDEAMVDFLAFSDRFLVHEKIATREKLSLFKISKRVQAGDR